MQLKALALIIVLVAMGYGIDEVRASEAQSASTSPAASPGGKKQLHPALQAQVAAKESKDKNKVAAAAAQTHLKNINLAMDEWFKVMTEGLNKKIATLKESQKKAMDELQNQLKAEKKKHDAAKKQVKDNPEAGIPAGYGPIETTEPFKTILETGKLPPKAGAPSKK